MLKTKSEVVVSNRDLVKVNKLDNLSLEILLIEDNLADVVLLREAMEQTPDVMCVVTHVERLDAGLKYLDTRSFDVVLLDLGLPDSQGLATINEIQARYPDVPILVLSGPGDENLVIRAVRDGAQDHLVKSTVKADTIALTIRYTIERKRSQQLLKVSEVGYKRLFETARDGILILDADTGKITDANPYLGELLGYTLDEFLGKRLWEIGPFRDKAASQAAFRTLQEKGYIRYEDLPLATRAGHFVPVEFVSNVYMVGDRQVIQCNIRDISQRKLAEREREIALQHAEERADRDPLTDLLNHRAFHKRLEDEIARSHRENSILAVAMLDLDNFKFFNDVYGHVVGDEVLRLVARHLQKVCRPYDTIARFGGDEFALLLPSNSSSSALEIEQRLTLGLRNISFEPEGHVSAVPVTVTVGVSLYPLHGLNKNDLVSLADERLRRAKTGAERTTEADQTREAMGRTLEGFSMLDALVTAVDNKDRYTRSHSEDVMTYCLQIARELGMKESDRELLSVSALLHDVGKIGVPDAILRKPGKLTETEYEAVKQHAGMGAAIVGAVPGLEGVLDAVRHHHEHWNGDGYPAGLRGEDIPFIARLMAVADAYSAMTMDRPYREKLTATHAQSVLAEGAGSQWDPQMVAAFLVFHQGPGSPDILSLPVHTILQPS